MNQPIARRDFLNGIAIGAGAVLAGTLPFGGNASAQEPVSSRTYPPTSAGLRGNYPAAVDIFGPITQGKYRDFPVPNSEITENYDLVIVGAGISGLSAAYFYRLGLGPDTKILILDNHDDFGGHAKRNEFPSLIATAPRRS